MTSLSSITRVLGATAACLVACTTATKGDEPPSAPEPATQAACPAKDPNAVTRGPTVHEGDVLRAETWTADESPHVIKGDVNVRAGAKLTIAACAVVELVEAASLNVAYPLTPNSGELVAEGTPDAPIRFESRDGARWNSIYVHAPGTARFAYATFEGGGGGDSRGHETIGVTGDGEILRPSIFVDHVTITGSRGAGLRIDGGASFMPGSRDLVITGSGANDASHPYPIEVGEQAIDSLPTGTYTGNAKDEIKIDPESVAGGGGFQRDATMHDRGVPYHVGETTEHDGLHVGNGNHDAVLTIEPGVKILFEKKTVLAVEADEDGASAIRAIGTKDKPIVFTSASPRPVPGDWRGLYFNGPNSAKNALEHVRIEYTGADCACSMVTCSAGVNEYEAAIIFSEEPKAMFLKHSVIAHGAGHGVVQGYDGIALDWKNSNSFDDVAGCLVTLPRQPDTSCPEPLPACK